MRGEPISSEEFQQILARVEDRTASDADYVELAAAFRSQAELELELSEQGAPAAGDQIGRAIEALSAQVAEESPPHAMAVWALGWTQDRRVVPTLLAAHRAAVEIKDEVAAARALRSAAAIAPRELKSVMLEAMDSGLPGLRDEGRFLAKQWRAANFRDLFGLGPTELFSVAAGPGDIASLAASALGSRFGGPAYEAEQPIEYQSLTHHPLPWSDDDREVALLACLEYLELPAVPNPRLAHAVGLTEDRRAAPVLAAAVRRALDSGQEALLYWATQALGRCGGDEHLEIFRRVAANAPDPATRQMAEACAHRHGLTRP